MTTELVQACMTVLGFVLKECADLKLEVARLQKENDRLRSSREKKPVQTGHVIGRPALSLNECLGVWGRIQTVGHGGQLNNETRGEYSRFRARLSRLAKRLGSTGDNMDVILAATEESVRRACTPDSFVVDGRTKGTSAQ